MKIPKKVKWYFFSFIIIIAGAISFSVFGSEPFIEENIEFLKSYGWEVEEAYYDKSEIIIPSPFDKVYENYNQLQTEAGLDLTPYMGKSCVRYTYIVTNYPSECEDTVFANVINLDGKCIGGDIMTVPLDGFMHSLSYNSPQNTKN